MTTGRRLLVVTPRPPLRDGQGDQRRADYAVCALAEDWTIEVVSWLSEAEIPKPGQWLTHPGRLLHAIALAAVRPIQVAYFQGWAGWSLRRRFPPHDLALFVTDRAVPPGFKGPYVIDFVDDLAGAAASRAAVSGRFRALLRWEARRLRKLDERLARNALLGLAVSAKDAAAIAPGVMAIPNAMETTPVPDTGTKIVFAGNLFFAPNLEAAMWICTELVPRLKAAGMEASDVVIAGRRPPAVLREAAAAAGVDLRGDVPDLSPVIAEASVVVVPVQFGSGAQNKVVDAVGADRPCVITPFTNEAFGLEDGRSVLVRERSPDAFAEAILQLRSNPVLRRRLIAGARQQLGMHTQAAVYEAWRDAFRDVERRLNGSSAARPEKKVDNLPVE